MHFFQEALLLMPEILSVAQRQTREEYPDPRTATGMAVRLATSALTSACPSIFLLSEGTIGTLITLTGADFGAKKGKVLVGGEAAKIVKDGWTRDSVTCEIRKPLTPGITYDVIVQRKEPKGVAPITLSKAFTIMAPEITSVLPDFGTEETVIEISGNFFSTKKGKVYLGEKKCKVLSWSMDKITFVVPKKMAPGPYDVTVTNKVGSVTLTDGFVIP